MGQVLAQLQLDKTFFIQFGIFAVLFLVMTPMFFRPFLRLFDIRHQRTIEDRAAAEKMMTEADARYEEYRKRLHEERQAAKKEYETMIAEARKEETAIIGQAREEAKRITHEANESIGKQREQLKKQIEADIESLANGISERLLSRKV